MTFYAIKTKGFGILVKRRPPYKHSAFNRQARVRLPSFPPEHCRKRLFQLSLTRMFCPGGVMAAALVLETSAFRACRFNSDLGHQFFVCTGSQAVEGIGLQIRLGNLARVRLSLCAPFFRIHASVAHLDRAPDYGGGKFESFRRHHIFPYKQTRCMRLAVNQHRARFDASVRSHFDVGFSSVVELRVVIPAVISSSLISQPSSFLHDTHCY